jgi:hypothetical protein
LTNLPTEWSKLVDQLAISMGLRQFATTVIMFVFIVLGERKRMSLTNLLLGVTIALLASLTGFVLWLYLRGRRDYAYFRYRLRRDRDGPYRYGPYRFDRHEEFLFGSPLFGLIERAERENGVNLSWAAREMLVIPVAEQLEEERPIEWRQVENSINKIVAAMREESSESHRSRRGEHNAVAVIRAFYQRFCNIPPFCSPTDETSTRS